MLNDYECEILRKRLAESPTQRKEAIAMFPLRVASMAYQLERICSTAAITGWTATAIEASEYIESKIKEAFQETFGVSFPDLVTSKGQNDERS